MSEPQVKTQNQITLQQQSNQNSTHQTVNLQNSGLQAPPPVLNGKNTSSIVQPSYTKVVPDFWCKVCLKSGAKKNAQFINLGDFNQTRYLCRSHIEGKTQLIPIYNKMSENSGRLWYDFNKNITINKGNEVSFKQAVEKFYKQSIQTALNQYENQILNSLKQTKNFLRNQFNAIVGTFVDNRIQQFIEAVEENEITIGTPIFRQKKVDYQELNNMAQSMRLSGNNKLNNLEQLLPLLKNFYKQTGDILDLETKNVQSHQKIFFASLSKKSIQKVAKKIRKVERKIQKKQRSFEDGKIEPQQGAEQDEDNKRQVLQLVITSTNFKKIFSNVQSRQLVTKIKFKYQTQEIMPLTLKNFAMCKNLEQLYIQEPLFGTKQMITFILNIFSKLKRVAWNCYNQFDEQCAALVVKNYTNIEKCYWGCNFYKSIGRMAQLRAFREHKKKKRRESIMNKALIEMAKKCKNLQNMWISDLDQQMQGAHQIIKQLKNMPKLKHLSLGKSHEPTMLSQQTWHQLCNNIKGLLSVGFLRIHVHQDYLIPFLQKNKSTLRTIVFYCCPSGLSDQIFRVMKTYSGLKQLYIYQGGDHLIDKKFVGKYIWELSQLETLSIRKCDFDFEYFSNKIGDMKDLMTLDLDSNYWINDLTLTAVAKLYKSLQFLNVGRTSITVGSNSSIASLKRLKCLILACTKLNHKSVEQIISSIPNLVKISIQSIFMGKSIINRGKMHWLGRTIKNCIYVDCSQCDRFDDRCFQTFNKIQFINLWNTMGVGENVKDYLRRRGVVIIDNSINT